MVTSTSATQNASASRTARQLFYWISMLVVMLIAAITVMEAFGVYFFPHRSWSEGIDAKVIQGRGGAVYYRYISVKPSEVDSVPPRTILMLSGRSGVGESKKNLIVKGSNVSSSLGSLSLREVECDLRRRQGVFLPAILLVIGLWE